MCLAVQGTWVQSLVRKDPMCSVKTNPGAAASEPEIRAHGPQQEKPPRGELESSPHQPKLEKPCT